MPEKAMLDQDVAALIPWAAEAERQLVGVTDEEEAARVFINLGVDEKTARQLASHHCGTHIGDVIDTSK